MELTQRRPTHDQRQQHSGVAQHDEKEHHGPSDRSFLPLLGAFFTVIIVLWAVAVRYGEFEEGEVAKEEGVFVATVAITAARHALRQAGPHGAP